MKQIFIYFCTFFINLTFAQDNNVTIHSSSSVSSQSRYEVIQSTLAAIWTFRLDRVCGQISQLVSTKNEGTAWQSMKIDGIPKCNFDGKNRYQLFTSGLAARHTFLINTETGKSWVLRTYTDNQAGEKSSAWFQFEE